MNVAQDRLAQEARPDAQPLATELLFAFLSLTGLRIGEALGARWGDLENGSEGVVLHVRRQ